MKNSTKKNRFIWPVGTSIALLVSFLLCRYLFFEQHGMKQYPVFLFAIGLIVIIIASIFDSRKIMICTVIGYIGGFALGMLFSIDGVDQGGGRTNNAWVIWTISLTLLVLLGIVWELWAKWGAKNMLFKIRREGIIGIIPSADGPTAVFYKTKIHIVLLIVCFSIGSLICGIFIGRALPHEPEIRFYANVLENKGTYLLVEGIPENDINHRSQFRVSLKDKNNKKSILDKEGKPIYFSDISEECLVNIVYDGIVLETFPGQISGAILIQIVE